MEITNYIINCSLSIFSGLIIYTTLVIIKQNWVHTVHHLMTYLILPPVAFVITKMISNNFALSLGMIGALSIVRFRTPVKNPLELVIFFSLVTLGITFGVSRLWGIGLTLVIVGIMIGSRILESLLSKFNFFPLSLSFNDELYGNFIEITSKKKIDTLENNPYLNYFNKEKNQHDENVYTYKLLIKDLEKINSIKNDLDKNNDITSIEIKVINK